MVLYANINLLSANINLQYGMKVWRGLILS